MAGLLLLVCKNPALQLMNFPVRQGHWLLGRGDRCDFVVTNPAVSRQHALISWRPAGVVVRDLASTNGTFVDDRRIETSELAVGQEVSFGGVGFVLMAETNGREEVDGDEDTPLRPQLMPPRMTRTQKRVLSCLKEGMSEKKIAGTLHRSIGTIHKHITALFRAHKVHSRSELLSLLLKALAGKGPDDGGDRGDRVTG